MLYFLSDPSPTSAITLRIHSACPQQPVHQSVALIRIRPGARFFALDCTNWKFGRRDVNILMLVVAREGIAVAILGTVMGRAGTPRPPWPG